MLHGVALVASVLLVVADFSRISYRTIGIGACSDRVDPAVCHTSGHESHAYALLILAPVALVMAWGAVVGRSRAAALALAAIGVTVLVIALAIDLPKLGDRRGLNVGYNAVRAHTGPAFKIELAGGVLLLLVGGLAAMRAGAAAEAPPGATAAERARARRSRRAATAGDPEDADEAERARYQPPPAAPASSDGDEQPETPTPG